MLFDHRRPLLAYLLCVALCAVVILTSLRGAATPGSVERYAAAAPSVLLPSPEMVDMVAATELARELGAETTAELVAPGIAVIRELVGPVPWDVRAVDESHAPIADQPVSPAPDARTPDVGEPAAAPGHSGPGAGPGTTSSDGEDGGGAASAGDTDRSNDGPDAISGRRGPADHALAHGARDRGPRAGTVDRQERRVLGKLRFDRTPDHGKAQHRRHGKAQHRPHGQAQQRRHGKAHGKAQHRGDSKAHRPGARRHPRR